MNDPVPFLFSLQHLGMKFGLRNIRTLLAADKDPHRSLRTIHIAGTNGKGSTSSMIAAILTAAGYRVGLYTSPHLVRFNERIRINGTPISNKEIERLVRRYKRTIRSCNATFFEATTAMAFSYFRDQKVDFAVIETGLGGRLDATNVLTPLVSVITTIGKDHQELLGNTFTAIAAEKGGIIKRRVPVVLGKISGPARTTLLQIAKERSSAVLDAMSMPFPYADAVELTGEHQQENARTAVAAVTLLAQHTVIGDKAIRTGLQRTMLLSGLQGRYQIIDTTPRLILDSAHNPDGIRILTETLRKEKVKAPVILFGVMKDKDYAGMLDELRRVSPLIVVTRPDLPRALDTATLYAVSLSKGLKTHYADGPAAALRTARKLAGKKGTVVITGSNYLLGEVMPLIQKTS